VRLILTGLIIIAVMTAVREWKVGR